MKQTKRAPKVKSLKNRTDEEIQELQQRYAAVSTNKETIKRFKDLPLSKQTLKGLADSKYAHPTDIQRESIGPALQGKDVLGMAQTGSGKTLAFLIPVLEHLYVNKWSRADGVNAIIISPTRELAYQIFETLKRVGAHHDFSAGLIIGGKNLKFERKRMDQCNILICTPGRLLQHMDENPLFDATTMEMLVLDEADRCLDMGFQQALNAIVENFPPQRQTLLFSATQTNSVQDLARLNLREPVYVGYQQQQKQQNGSSTVAAVPELLQQSYVVVELADKITMLWSFIRNHQKQKIIVFLTSCKQVKYTYEIFCKLRPGTSLLALYGTLHQDRRIAIYNDFVKKSNVVLFATDIASRGLDFPAVNWVVQLDCPENVTQYIHRAGRSARNKARGECLLVLLPSEEEAMVAQLTEQKLSVRQIHIDPKKLFSPRVKMEAFLAQSSDLKASAQRAFVSYLKSIFLMRNKAVFNVTQLDFDAYAKSLGLAVTPRVRFLERFMRKKGEAAGNSKQSAAAAAGSDSDDEDDDADNDNESSADEGKPVTATGSKKERNFNMLRSDSTSEDDDDEDFIRLKRVDHDIQPHKELDTAAEAATALPLPVPKKEKLITKAALAKKAIKKKLQINEKRKFDEDGQEIVDARKQLQSDLAKKYAAEGIDDGGIDIAFAKKLLNEEDKYDKQRFRELVKQRHKQRKEKQKKRNADDEADETMADDGQADDSDNSVDLSWLPDPKKVYNKTKATASDEEELEDAATARESMSSADDNDDESDDDNERDFHAAPAKKKMKFTAKLSLNDAEIIAAQLLAKSV